MPGNLVPAQMYDHSLVLIKSPSRLNLLDYAAAPADGESFFKGALTSLNSAGKLVKGLEAGGWDVRPMPIFAIQGTDSFDANSDVGNLSGGVNSGYPATGGFEMETTEYVSTTYAPNDLLTAAASASLGKVKKATVSPYGDEPIVGCVSKGVNTNRDGISVLRFWTLFLPAGTNLTSSSSAAASSSSAEEAEASSSSAEPEASSSSAAPSSSSAEPEASSSSAGEE